MLKSTCFYPNQKNTNCACSLPPDTCSVSDMVGVNLFTKLDDCKVNKSKLIYDKCGKDLKCKIDDKTINELKENIKSELEKGLKCKIDDKTMDELKKNIKSELEKGLKFEIGDKTKNELKKNIKDELKEDLKCEIDDKTKDELKDKIKKEINNEINCDMLKMCNSEKITKEVDEAECNREGCELAKKDGEYIDIDSDAKLYIRKALDKFYPDLSAEIIDKINAGDYYVHQFGIRVTNCDKNGGHAAYITSRGSMDAQCVTIPASSLCKESYNLQQDVEGDWYENCKNHIFDDNAHVVSTKVYYQSGSIDKNKPAVVLSQSQPLIIADKKTHKLVKKDGTISDKTIDECREFFDSEGKITNCAEDKEDKRDCEVCKETIWDFPDVVPVFFI